MHEAGAAIDLAPLLKVDPVEEFPAAWAESLLRLQ
jgi:hypothetical protein